MIGHPNLKCWWSLNGNYADGSGNGKTLTANGTISFVAGVTGTAASGNFGSSNWLSHTSILATPIGTSDFTVSVWFKKATPPTADFGPCILDIGVPDRSTTIRLAAGKTTGYASFLTYNAGEYPASSTVNICNDNWRHLCGVRIGATLFLYVDGVLVATASGAAHNITASNFRVGQDGAGAYDVLGPATVEDIQVYTNFGAGLSDIKRIRQGKHPLSRS
ncbi:MAG TPA: hypothetical protein DCZ63_14780 [Geobacter sp.]|nr:hypothetical protein [Geobacter sp.]